MVFPPCLPLILVISSASAVVSQPSLSPSSPPLACGFGFAESAAAFSQITPPSAARALPSALLHYPTRRAALASSASAAASGLLALMSSPRSASASTSSSVPSSSAMSSPEPFSRGQKVGWGIVGLGDVTAIKSGPPFWKCDGSNLVAVMRRTPGAAEEWVRSVSPSIAECAGAEGGGAKVNPYDDLDAFLSDPNLEAVYVATPPGSHLEIARRVAEAGKACYVEKPVGRCGFETRAIVDAFQSKGLPLFTAYISRAYERTEAVRTLLANGACGDRVTSISYKLRGSGLVRGMDTKELPWRVRAPQSGGGLIMDVGCHVLDRIDYLCGPLLNTDGSAENKASPMQEVEDYVELRATVGGCNWSAVNSEGAAVECVWDFASDSPLDELIIKGPGGSLRMAAMSPSLPVEVLDASGKVIQTLTFAAPEHTAQALIQSVTDELRGVGERKCPGRGDNAIRTSEALDAVLGSYYGGRDDGFWERAEMWPGNKNKGS